MHLFRVEPMFGRNGNEFGGASAVETLQGEFGGWTREKIPYHPGREL
jgi:hypothetical protein